MSLWSDEIETELANTGENVKLKLKNTEEEDIQGGFVICSPESLVRTSHVFDAQVIYLVASPPVTLNRESSFYGSILYLTSDVTFTYVLSHSSLGEVERTEQNIEILHELILFCLKNAWQNVYILLQIVILEHKSIICAGYSAILHIHTCEEECTLKVCRLLLQHNIKGLPDPQVLMYLFYYLYL